MFATGATHGTRVAFAALLLLTLATLLFCTDGLFSTSSKSATSAKQTGAYGKDDCINSLRSSGPNLAAMQPR
tara:strand:+ start:336 stop:551 length:216 start_codon:yes stop_codon:yes gene_type:complete